MRTLACLTVVFVTTGIAAADASGGVQLPTTRGAHSCGTPQVAAPLSSGVARFALAPGAQRTVYLNRFGGTYTVASVPTDSATNQVNTLVSADRRARTATIAPLGTQFDWPTIVACVKEHYAAINVRFVEAEPTSGPYIEAVVGGNGSELGFSASAGILGIAAADNFCKVTESGIAFSFSGAHAGIASRDVELCTTISHEIGHLLALEHETLATDLMSYVPVTQSPSKGFVDQYSACGTYPQQPSACSCAASQQNSFERLELYVGPRPVETTAPTLEVESPGAGTEVPPVFEVIATASDEAMADVRVLVDGIEAGSAVLAPDGRYVVRVRDVALGARQLTVIARDQAGNETTKSIAITVAKAAIGETCVANEACEGNLCAATAEDGMFCTQTCDLAAESCPDGFACAAAGQTSVCVPDASGGCGCQTQDPRDGAGILLLVGLGLVISRRRRRS